MNDERTENVERYNQLIERIRLRKKCDQPRCRLRMNRGEKRKEPPCVEGEKGLGKETLADAKRKE